MSDLEARLEQAHHEIDYLEAVEALIGSGRIAQAAELLGERRRLLEDFVAGHARPVGPRPVSTPPMTPTLAGIMERLKSPAEERIG